MKTEEKIEKISAIVVRFVINFFFEESFVVLQDSTFSFFVLTLFAFLSFLLKFLSFLFSLISVDVSEICCSGSSIAGSSWVYVSSFSHTNIGA